MPNIDGEEGKRRNKLGRKIRMIHNHAGKIAELPAPDEGPWKASEMPDHVPHQKFVRRGLINNADAKDGNGTTLWESDERVYQEALDYLEKTPTLPCGHKRPKNVRNGGFECKDCGAPCSREEAKEVFGL